MVKQREGHTVIFSDLAKQRIKEQSCPACGKPKSEWSRRRDWRCCSLDCTNKFWQEQVKIKSWQDLREKCFDRDGWKCVKCGKQPTILVRKGFESPTQKILKIEYIQEWHGDMATCVDTLIADHIIAIALGGEEWDINNLQTLCPECNKIKTADDFGKIAKLRDIEKKQSNGQTQLSEVKVADGTPTTGVAKAPTPSDTLGNDGIPPNTKVSGILPTIL